MSIEVTNAVWKHSRQKSGTLLVLLALADYTNSEGIAWPAVSTLAGKARMSERNVQRCVRALQKAGELEVRQNQGRKGSNIYRIRLLPDVNTPDATDIRDASVAKGVSPTSLTSDAVVTQSVSEPLIESTPIVPKGDEIEFWIQVCFDCFKLTRHPLPVHVLRRLARDIRFLDRKNADSLRRFYKCEPLTSKKPPYNSRRHSPERLLLHLPCQLGLALQEFPPLTPLKETPFSLEEVHQCLREEYPNCVVPRSLAELDTCLWDSMREEIYELMRKKKGDE
jgi:Helix-turn-helix domain